MANSVINIQSKTWTYIDNNNISFQVIGDREVYFCHAESTPTGTPPNNQYAQLAIPDIHYNFRPYNALDGLYIYTPARQGANISIDSPVYMDIYKQDQSTPPVEHWLTYLLEEVTIQSNVLTDSNTFVLNAGAGSTIVNIISNYYYLEMKYYNTITGEARFYQSEIITYTDNVVNVTIETDTPLDFDMDITYIESAYITDTNAARVSVGSSTANRKMLETSPPDGLSWDLTRIIVAAVFDDSPDDAKFCGGTALTWGIYFGFVSPIYRKYLVNVKTNGDFRSSAFDVTYVTRSNPLSSYGLGVRKTFNGDDKYGVVVRLNGNTEKFGIWLQENFLTQDAMRFKIMGHEVE